MNYQKIEEYQRVFDTFKTIEAAFYYFVIETNELVVTHGIERIFGISKELFDSDYCLKALYPEDKDRVLDWQKKVFAKKKADSIECRIVCSDGKIKWVRNHLSPILNMFGEIERILGLFMDITSSKELEQRIEYLAFHDHITDLPNRNMFNEYVQRALSRCKRNGLAMAILFIDLDRFKNINDTLGHDMGDLVLKQVAERLNHCVRESDIVTRQGGDEFIVLLEDTDNEKTEQIAQRILSSVSAPIDINNEELFITASIGISLFPEHGEEIEALITNADKAMYKAKEYGMNFYYFYRSDMQNQQHRKIRMEQALRKAQNNNEFVVYYQPLIDFYSGNIIAVEALLRWDSPTFGMVYPLELIPIAEETGLINSIGEWVLENACAQNKRWQDAGYNPLKIIVNVSNHQFRNPNFLKTVKNVLIKTGLDPAYLQLDMSEGFLQKADEALPVTQELLALGVRISVDNFGSECFSFNVLNRLPIEYLKIGKNLLHDLQDEYTVLLIKAIIQLAKMMNLKLIAEGIENEEHLEFLKNNHCYIGQGDFYCPPVPAEQASEYIQGFQAWKSKYGGLEGHNHERIQKIEEENRKLKVLLAELTLETHNGN